MTKIAFVDAESYYDQDYSLRKMSPAEYIMDGRFECFGWSVAEDDGPTRWLNHEQFIAWLKTLPAGVTFVSHNALFDMFILVHIYGYTPAMMICTMSMARAMLYAKTGSVSLANVAKHLGLQDKGNTIQQVKGMRWRDIEAAGLAPAFIQYAVDDTDICRGIFLELIRQGFPREELFVMDTVIRCSVKPVLGVDVSLLHTHAHQLKTAKDALLQKCGISDVTELRSNDRFADLLRMFGVEPPTKISPKTGKEAYAFAKTDVGLNELEEHPEPMVQALVAARIGVKSTLEETRTQRYIALANIKYPSSPTSLMPIPLRYSAAHTHRLGGDWKLNLQNLPKGGNLRKSIVAKNGCKVVTADESQVEARLVAWFCGQTDLMNQFANGEDVYCSFATQIYNREITKADKTERFCGKQGVLGLGFQLGKVGFHAKVHVDAHKFGFEIDVDELEAARIVGLYRNGYSRVPAMWKYLQYTIIPMLAAGGSGAFGPNDCIKVEKHTLILPSGLRLFYHGLTNEDGDWWFKYGREHKKLFGGKLLENIIQALARIIVMDAGLRIKRRTGLNYAIQVHDELGYMVPTPNADKFSQYLLQELRTRPAWGPDIPLDAECEIANSFGGD